MIRTYQLESNKYILNEAISKACCYLGNISTAKDLFKMWKPAKTWFHWTLRNRTIPDMRMRDRAHVLQGIENKEIDAFNFLRFHKYETREGIALTS